MSILRIFNNCSKQVNLVAVSLQDSKPFLLNRIFFYDNPANSTHSLGASGEGENAKNLIERLKSKYNNVMVNANKDNHFLDRLKVALRSDCIQDVLNRIRGRDKCKDLYMNLRLNVMNSWPDISHKEAFYSISWNCLEDWLSACDFYFDDGEKLLDMCSAWIMHDLKTRYKLIPQVAFAIKRYGSPDYKDYEIETPEDFGSISQKSIRDKLWDILSSSSLISDNTNEPRKFEEWPVFVTSTSGGTTLNVLNVNCNLIATISFPKLCTVPSFFSQSYFDSSLRSYFPMSAAIVKDTLFILYKISTYSKFLAYNVPSNKFIELGTDSRINIYYDKLLSCRDQLYCCSFQNGSIMKYSFELNRWISFLKSHSILKDVHFTSDGDKIYRLYQLPGTEFDPTPEYNVEWYDFDKNQWISLSSLPSPLPKIPYHVVNDIDNKVIDFTVVNDGNPAVLFKNCLLWYDSKSQTSSYDLNSEKWRVIKLPASSLWFEKYRKFNFSATAHVEDGFVQVFSSDLFLHSNYVWESKKNIINPHNPEDLPYLNIVAVNRPTVRVE